MKKNTCKRENSKSLQSILFLDLAPSQKLQRIPSYFRSASPKHRNALTCFTELTPRKLRQRLKWKNFDGGAAHDISASLWLMLLPKDGWEIRGFAHVSTACAHSRRHLSARRCHRPKPSRTSWGAASFSRSVRQIFHSVQLDFLWIFYLWKDQTKSSLKVRIIYSLHRRIFFKFFKECLLEFMILHQSDCDI